MPRRPRTHVAGGFYHVTLRGNHRQPIFACDHDRDVLDSMVADILARLDSSIHAYCWMTNHLHLVVQVGDEPLSRLMHRLATRYARYFQKGLGTTGHLFERRYHAVLVRADQQLLAAVRYVHRNPVRAGLVADPAGYRWSGHRGYLGLCGPAWLRTAFVLSLLAVDPATARSAYAGLVANPSPGSGGGEAAGWPPDSQPAETDPHPARSTSPNGRRAPVGETLDELIARICVEEGVTEADLRSRSRARRFAGIRARIALECRDSGFSSLSVLARRFDRHVASLSKAVTRREGSK
jgi:REP element-mobilizing transposase RayT